ncbi:CD209 antigen-like protein C [Mytilus californianus]|uniref:CD209 antigen-like protein C n=1 Tax=Mytilus californianus TaxID=6549 RepID=UPI0022483DA2|nr:CD209 antigen-like protein C [Mytilus californianus]
MENTVKRTNKCTGGNRLLIIGILVFISTTMIMTGLFISLKIKSDEKVEQCSLPCTNGGTCKVCGNAYVCDCPSNSLGSLCQYTCDIGWSLYETTCFNISTLSLSWNLAKDSCRSMDGRLAEQITEGKHAFIQQLDVEIHGTAIDWLWLGGTDMDSEGNWIWNDSKKTLNLTFWRPGEPNDAGSEDCLATHTGVWNDIPCTAEKQFVCEKSIAT